MWLLCFLFCRTLQVRNRTPQEIKDGVPLSQARDKELAYFESHPQLQASAPL